MNGFRSSLIGALILPCIVAFSALVSPETTVAAPTRQKPAGLKRPTAKKAPPSQLVTQPREAMTALFSEGISSQAAGSNYTATPPPSASFDALISDGSAFNPDTSGAVGPNHLMVALNTQVRIQTRSGGEVMRMGLDAWWAQTVPGASNIFDPRVVYDPYGNRFIFSANNDPGGPNPGLLIAVSATSDPTGIWHRRFIDIDATRPVFADAPNIGFNKNWIVLTADTFTNAPPFEFAGAEIYVYHKTNFYSNGALAPTRFLYTDTAALVPVVTYDPTFPTNYIVAEWTANFDGFGYLTILAIGGPVSAPVFVGGTNGGITFPEGPAWSDSAGTENFAPQTGTTNKIALGDSRIRSATWRGGTIQAAQTVFLPAVNPTRAAVQWWEFTEDSTFRRGYIDSGNEGRMYAYPSIAANRGNDMLIGFSRFATNEFPSAAYAFRQDADEPDSIRRQVILKSGNAPYFRTNLFGENIWGDWTATMIDPLNDTDFWTIQQYAEFPDAATDRWGTWWGRISPPNDMVITAVDSPDPVVAGSNLTYTITVTNLASRGSGPNASGVRISNALPATVTFVSASASQGSCTHSAGIVICDLGTLTNLTRATATIVVKPRIVGSVTNTIEVHANGPDADYNDNQVTVITETLPSADLAVLIAQSHDRLTVSGQLTYTVTVTNQGPAAATLVRLTNNLPPSCTFISAVPSSGSCSNSGALVTCSLASTMAANGSETVTITVRPNTAAITISNRAVVAASSIDPEGPNNTASILAYVNARPTITAIANQTINEDTTSPAIAFTIGDVETPVTNLIVGLSSTDPSLIPLGNIVMGGSGASRSLTITPTPNNFGSSVIGILITDQDGATTNRTFTVTVNSVNDVPTISVIATPVTIDEDTSTAELPFTIGDVETPASSLTLTAGSSNLPLVPVGNIAFGGSGANRTVRVTPLTNQVGSATITVTVSDGVASSNRMFVVTVTQVNDPPVITPIADRTVNEDTSTGPIAFNIIDVESAGTLTLSASSTDTSIVPTNNIVFGGSGTNRTVTITPATNQHGPVQITITVSDGSLADFSSFNLTVLSVNDAPTLNALSNVTTNEDAGSIVVPLSGITSGAANENQTLSVTVSNSNPAIVDALISYTPNQTSGSLVLDTVANAVGSATLTVRVDDGISNVARSFTLTLTAVNDTPTISSIENQNIDEDTVLSVVPFTIGDVETAATSLTLTAGSSDAAIVPVANITFGGAGASRNVTVRPATNQFGVVTITITVSDGVLTNATRFQLTVNSINDAPRFVTPVGDRSIPEDTAANIPFVIGDVETPAGSLTVVATQSSNPALAPLDAISFGGSGSNRTIVIMPLTNQVGSSTITLRLNDGLVNVFDSFVLTVTNVNDAPQIVTALPNHTILEDTSTPVVPFTVDDEETPGALTVSGGSSNPTLIPVANIAFAGSGTSRTVQVTPAANQFGSATVTVFVSDGAALGSNSFLVTVTPVNDAPIISTPPNVVTNEDFATIAIPFTVRDAETPAASLIVVAESSNPEVVDETGLILGGSGTNRTITVRPLTNQVGSLTISLTVTDASNAVAMTQFEVEFVEVNDRPSISNIGNLTVNEDTNAVSILFTIDDPETLPQNLTVSASSSNPALVPNDSGNLVLGGGGATRTLTIVPVTNQFGATTISISVSDGTLTNTDSFVLTVNAINDAPTITAIADQTIVEDASTGPLAFTIDDVETAETLLTLLVASSNPTVIPLAGITLGGAGANRTVTVKPATNQFGASDITISVGDGALTNSVTFTVIVISSNDPPVFLTAPGNQTFVEDGVVTLPFTISDVETPLASLTVEAHSSNPELIDSSGITLEGATGSRSITLRPLLNQFGASTITLTLRDQDAGTATHVFTVSVTSSNDTPRVLTGVPDQVIDEDTATATLAFTIDDVETPVNNLTVTAGSSSLTLVPVANIALGGSGAARTVRVTPAPNQFGTATISLNVSDGVSTGVATFQLTVTSVNDLPFISPIANVTTNEDMATVALPFRIIDVETAGANLGLTGVSSNPSLVPNTNVVFGGSGTNRTVLVRPATNQYGFATITVTVRDDSGGTNSTDFDLVFLPVNDPPTLVPIADQVIAEDTTSTPISISVNDVESAPGDLLVMASSSNTTLVPNSGLMLGGAGAARTLTIAPAFNQTGSSTITVTVMDTNGVSVSDPFVLTVTAANDAPTISGLPNLTIDEDTATGPLSVTVSDADSATLTLTGASSNPTLVPPANITFGGAASNRTVTVTPAANQTGMATITVRVSDGSASNSMSFSLTVTPVNDPPTLNAIANLTIAEDALQQTVNLAGIGAGVNESQALVVTATSSNPALIPNPQVTYTSPQTTGSLRFTPTPNSNGVATITVTVDDGEMPNRFASRTFTVTVTAANDLPAISNIADFATGEDTPASVDFTVGDLETAASSLTLTGTSSNPTLLANTNILFHGSGSQRTLTVVPGLNQFGTSTVTVTVSDGVATANDTFVLTVIGTNDFPTLDPIRDVYVNQGAALTNIVLTGITRGATNETQTLSVSNSFTTDIFQTDPAVAYTNPNPTAVLSFRPGNQPPGSSVVTVFVRENTNVNFITSQSFTIYVRPTGNSNAPTISTITNRSTLEDTPIIVPFTVGDSQTPADSLVVSAMSTNRSLFPSNSFVFNGSGSNRTLTVTPALNQVGSAAITVGVTDGNFGGRSSNFVLTVTAVNDLPVISSISSPTIDEDTSTGPLSFAVSDVETPAGSLTMAGTSSNPALIPNASIVFGGSGTNRSVTVTPLANQHGSANIEVVVTDANSGRATNVFTVTVAPVDDPPTISVIGPVVTSEDTPSAAAPFTVGDLETPAASLTLSGTSSNPTLIQNIQFGGAGANRTVILTPAPDAFGSAVITVMLSDGGPVPTTVTFDATIVPVNDPPTLDSIENLTGVGSGERVVALSGISSGRANEAQTLFGAATSSNPALIPHPTVTYTSPNSTGSLAFTPLPNMGGSATITVTVNDGQPQNNTVVRTFTVGLNNPPTITDITNRVTNEDVQLDNVLFMINDLETDPDSLTLSAVSSNTDLVPSSAIRLLGRSTNRAVFFQLAPNASGVSLITVTVADALGATASDSFVLTVNTVNDAPTLGAIAGRTIVQNSGPHTVNLVGITAGPGESQSLRVRATSDNPSLIADPQLNYTSPSGVGTLVFTPVTDAMGSANITVTVFDDGGTANGGQNSSSQSFTVNVTTMNPPELAILRAGNMVTISWPDTAGSRYVLESRGSFTEVWGSAGTPSQSGGRYSVTQTLTTTNQFYRLRFQ